MNRLVKQRRNREKQANSTISTRTSWVADKVDKNKANNRVLFLEALYHQAAVGTGKQQERRWNKQNCSGGNLDTSDSQVHCLPNFAFRTLKC